MRIGRNVHSFFDDEGNGRYPLYATKKAFERTFDLLYWDVNYAWIKNFRRFMADLSSHQTLHCCRSFLAHFGTEEVRKTQKLYCPGVDTTGQVLLLHEEARRPGRSGWRMIRMPTHTTHNFQFFILLYRLSKNIMNP